MPFVLHSHAVLRDGQIVRFQSSDAVDEGETLLPVIADPDPVCGPNERLWGPEYEVLPDRVRAYGRAMPMDPEEIAARDAAILRLSFAQLLIGLVSEGWITEAEGEAWIAGTLPAAVMGVISTLPQPQRFAAKARALRPETVLRNDPLVIALGAAQGKTPEEIDAFFAGYSAA